MQINFTVQDINIYSNGEQKLTKDSIGIVKLHFDVSGDMWQGITVYEVLLKNSANYATYSQLLDSNFECYIPALLLTKVGTLELALKGTKAGEQQPKKKIKTYPIEFFDNQETLNDGKNARVSQTLFEQYLYQVDQKLLLKQDKLISGTNIKTINNQSILGAGNLQIAGGDVDDVKVNNISVVENRVANINISNVGLSGNINDLIQNESDYLILDCGTSLI